MMYIMQGVHRATISESVVAHLYGQEYLHNDVHKSRFGTVNLFPAFLIGKVSNLRTIVTTTKVDELMGD